tara:strand:+ start:48416 stop:49954 length:1539 start_codon:yes stop_codon:yes gene_type:complete
MKLTDEQEFIIKQDKSLIVEAAAGGGKTSTSLEKTRHFKDQSFLYMAFNKSVQVEANEKFGGNVKCVTAHGLAYRNLGVYKNFEMAKYGNLHMSEIQKILGIPKKGPEEYYGLKLASHIFKKFNLFCSSNEKSIEDIHYGDVQFGDKARDFVSKYIGEIEKGAKELWEAMKDGKCPITHDFYLKLYSLNPGKLNYDWIIVDEGQDCSQSIIDIVLPQKESKKLVLFDRNQRIYGFRSAIDNIEDYFDYEKSFLSNSFRFKQDVADLCNSILNLKEKYLDRKVAIDIKGVGNTNEYDSKAIIGRSNVALFTSAVNYAGSSGLNKSLYFEGGLNNYVNVGSYSIYDLINLKINKPSKIRSEFVKEFACFDDFEEFIDSTDDNEAKVLASLVKKYGGTLFGIISNLKRKETTEKKAADLVFSTVHKSKGLEYDIVELTAFDYINESRIMGYRDDNGEYPEFIKDMIVESLNILYVAASRTKNKLIFPKSDFMSFNSNEILKESLGRDMSSYLSLI